MGKVIVIGSGKGGTGKTTFAVNLGTILAEAGGNVALLDMNMGLRNMDIYLGLENKVVYDISDALSGLCRIRQALVKDNRFPNLSFMASSYKKDKAEITPLHVKVLCDKLRERFDIILIDAPAGVGKDLEIAAAGADSAIIVTTPEHVAVRDADILDSVFAECGIMNRAFVLNKVKSEYMNLGIISGIDEVAEKLKIPMIGIIQYDDNIYIAGNNGVPIVTKKDTYIEENFKNIAARVITEL